MPRLLACAAAFLVAAAHAEPVQLKAADGLAVYGDVWRAAGPKPPWIVAFHQADASGAEYAPIAPRLVAAGFSVLAIDQRSGSGFFGRKNRTAAGLGREASFDEALPDLEAALAWAKTQAGGAPVVAMGSSYSAALVFLLAAAHPGDVAGVVSLSPDEYLANKHAVRDAARRYMGPVYIDQASDAGEVKAGAAVLQAAGGLDKQQQVSRAPATHGASMLRADMNAAGTDAHWKNLLRFLGRFRDPVSRP